MGDFALKESRVQSYEGLDTRTWGAEIEREDGTDAAVIEALRVQSSVSVAGSKMSLQESLM